MFKYYEYIVKKNHEEAVKWFQKAANQGDVYSKYSVYSHYSLGCMYQEGKGVDQDLNEAVRLYTLAADQGNAPAQYNLGWMYENVRGVNESFQKAARWYRLAVDQGHVEEQNALELTI
ncbi:hypothetical protein DID78_04400 [Candidatus Marinamargulisbacteria bacterium SCGC AG-343-D04]|nr:hypothetical protein DID78_04400 [Candidatus Marinamargulisbacteria bacterium SCGC AG-343-D04]